MDTRTTSAHTQISADPEQEYFSDGITEIIIEALLVDEELADLVWYMWDAEHTDNRTASIAWMLIACVPD